jgi:hypothetical protein
MNIQHHTLGICWLGFIWFILRVGADRLDFYIHWVMKSLYALSFMKHDVVYIATIVVMLLLLIAIIALVVNWIVKLVAKAKNRRITDFDIIDKQGRRHKGFFSNPSVFHTSTGEVFVKVGPAKNDWERVE